MTRWTVVVAAALGIVACGGAQVPPGRTAYATAAATAWTPADPRDEASLIEGLAAVGLAAHAEPEAEALARDEAQYVVERDGCPRLTGASESRLGFREGLFDHHVRTTTWDWHDGVDESVVATQLREYGTTPPAPSDTACPVAVGAARATKGGRTAIVVVVASRCVSLSQPLPRVLAPGDTVVVDGTVAAGYRATAIELTTPDGRVVFERLAPSGAPPVPGAGGPPPVPQPFRWRHTFRDAGRYVVELVAEHVATGPTPVLKAELLVGVAASPANEHCAAPALDAPEHVAARTLELINDARGRLGVAPLALEPRLTQVATAHSADMRDQHYFGHWSPSGSTPEQRARASGAPISSQAENVSGGSTAEDMHDGLMESPGHRASIVDPSFTHVGIGVVASADQLLLTELFGRIAPDLDLPRDRAAAVDTVTRATGHAPEADPRLESAAQAAAERFFAPDAPTEDAVCGEANRAVAGYPAVRGNCETWAIDRLDRIGELEIFRQGFDRFGIGLAQGHREGGMPRQLFIVVVAAQTRRANVDVRAFERRVLDAANAARAERHVAPIAWEESLAGAARELAGRWLRGDAPDAVYADADHRRAPLHLDRLTTRYQAGELTDPAHATDWDVLMDPRVVRVAIGAVQGDHPGSPRNTIGVFVYGVEAR